MSVRILVYAINNHKTTWCVDVAAMLTECKSGTKCRVLRLSVCLLLKCLREHVTSLEVLPLCSVQSNLGFPITQLINKLSALITDLAKLLFLHVQKIRLFQLAESSLILSAVQWKTDWKHNILFHNGFNFNFSVVHLFGRKSSVVQ